MRRLLFAILLLMPVTSVWACGVCADRMIMFHLPFAGWFALLAAVWLAVMALARNAWSTVECDASPLCPTRRLLVCSALWGSVVLAGLFVISGGSLVGSALLISLAWLMKVACNTVDYGIKGLREARNDRPSRGCLIINSVFLLLAVCAVPASYAYAYSTPGLISKLHYADSVSETDAVHTALAAKGEVAVAPLIATAKKSLEHDSSYGRRRDLSSAAACLGRIGGEHAASFLGELTRTRIDFKQIADRPWQQAVCFAYGECGGAAAVPDLVGLYARCGDATAERQRWAILSALARTRSRQGLEFVFDHLDVLLERAGGGGNAQESDLAEATVKVLLTGSDPNALKAINKLILSGEPRIDYDQVWQTSRDQIRKRWLDALK